MEQVSDDEEKIGWSVNNDDEDAQRWASRNVAFAPKRPLLQPFEQRLLRTTPIKKRPAHSTGVMSRPATASQIPPPASPEEWDARRPHTRGELREREFLSIGYASPPARSMDDVPWNSVDEHVAPRVQLPSKFAGRGRRPTRRMRRRRRDGRAVGRGAVSCDSRRRPGSAPPGRRSRGGTTGWCARVFPRRRWKAGSVAASPIAVAKRLMRSARATLAWSVASVAYIVRPLP